MKVGKMKDDGDFKKKYTKDLYYCYKALSEQVVSILRTVIKKENIPIAQFENRAKEFDSIEKKIKEKKYPNPEQDIKDFAGIRIITFYYEDVLKIKDIIHNEFSIDNDHSLDKLENLKVDEFGYRSFHLVCQFNEKRIALSEYQRFKGLYFEIQVRSVLQHAWAAVSHKLYYKKSTDAPEELQRKLFRLSALFELADEQFTQIRKETVIIGDKYSKDLKEGKLDISLNMNSLEKYFTQESISKHWLEIGKKCGMKYDDVKVTKDMLTELLKTLNKMNITSIHELNKLLSIKTEEIVKILSNFVYKVKKRGGSFSTIPVDMVNIFLLINHRDRIPDGFIGERWNPEIKDTIKSYISES
jgi:ppGpp synthetase/RelA/SpoT-type nucleotidyltranferase